MNGSETNFDQYRNRDTTTSSTLHPMSFNGMSQGSMSVGGLSYQQQQQLAYQQRMAAMQYQQQSYHAAAAGMSYGSNYSNTLNTYSSAIHAMNQNSTRSLGQPAHIIAHSQSSIILPNVTEDKATAVYDPSNPSIPPPPSTSAEKNKKSPQLTKLSDPDQRSPSIDYGEFSLTSPTGKPSKSCCVVL